MKTEIIIGMKSSVSDSAFMTNDVGRSQVRDPSGVSTLVESFSLSSKNESFLPTSPSFGVKRTEPRLDTLKGCLDGSKRFLDSTSRIFEENPVSNTIGSIPDDEVRRMEPFDFIPEPYLL